MTNRPVEFEPGEASITVVVTDHGAELSGHVVDGDEQRVAGAKVIAFAADDRLWRAESRYIRQTRADANGAYVLRDLLPGDYLVTIVDGSAAYEPYDAETLQALRGTAVRVSLKEGDKKAIDIKLSVRPDSERRVGA